MMVGFDRGAIITWKFSAGDLQRALKSRVTNSGIFVVAMNVTFVDQRLETFLGNRHFTYHLCCHPFAANTCVRAARTCSQEGCQEGGVSRDTQARVSGLPTIARPLIQLSFKFVFNLNRIELLQLS